MAGFETPKYIPPKDPLRGIKPATDKKPWGGLGSERGFENKVNANWTENLRGTRGHIQGPLRNEDLLSPAEANENMIRSNMWADIHGEKNYNNNPFKEGWDIKERLPLPGKFQPPENHPIRTMGLPPSMRTKRTMPFPYPDRSVPEPQTPPPKPLGPWNPWNK